MLVNEVLFWLSDRLGFRRGTRALAAHNVVAPRGRLFTIVNNRLRSTASRLADMGGAQTCFSPTAPRHPHFPGALISAYRFPIVAGRSEDGTQARQQPRHRSRPATVQVGQWADGLGANIGMPIEVQGATWGDIDSYAARLPSQASRSAHAPTVGLGRERAPATYRLPVLLPRQGRRSPEL